MNKQAFIHVRKEIWQDDYSVHLFDCDMSAHGYILISQEQLTFDLPTKDEIVLKHIEHLKDREQKLKADFVLNQENIKDEIQSLQQLTYKEQN